MKSKNKGIKWIIGIIALVAIGMYFIPKIKAPKEVAGDEIEVKIGNINTYYSFSGSIEAKNRQIMFAEQAMQIKEFEVKVGDQVKKDDVVYKDNKGTNMKSPIDGEILAIFIEEDEQLMPGAKIIEIVDYNDLQLKVKVDEYDLKAIQKDLIANITIHSLNKDVEGTVTDISKEGTYMNGVTFFDTTMSIVNEGDISVGMSAEAKILNESAEGVGILPMTALKFHDDNSPYVNIKKDKVVEDIDVELGITDGINVEIKSGIKSGERVFVPRSTTVRFGPPEGVREMSGGGNN